MHRKSTALLAAIVALTVAGYAKEPAITKEVQAATTPTQALQQLKDGNARFVAGQPKLRHLREQVKATAAGQFPIASIVSCLDSRTSAELVFDQGLGDVFNARVAGNIVNSDILGNLEFASVAMGSKLVAVIGHTKCGAVMGACDHVDLGNLTALLDKIGPAVDATQTTSGERNGKNMVFVDAVAAEHVRRTIAAIRAGSPILSELEGKGQIQIVGGMHDLETGKVTFLN